MIEEENYCKLIHADTYTLGEMRFFFPVELQSFVTWLSFFFANVKTQTNRTTEHWSNNSFCFARNRTNLNEHLDQNINHDYFTEVEKYFGCGVATAISRKSVRKRVSVVIWQVNHQLGHLFKYKYQVTFYASTLNGLYALVLTTFPF